jgi:hypothetical protein
LKSWDQRGKRELEPTFTQGWQHISHLRKKLPWLYGSHPFVKSQAKVAEELQVSPATLSNWLNGHKYKDATTTATVNPDSIPIRYYRAFLDIWGFPSEIVEMQDVDEFRKVIDTFETGWSAWDKLVRSIPDDPLGIEFVLEDATASRHGVLLRGFEPDPLEEVPGLLQLRTGDEVMIRARNPSGYAHAFMLSDDRQGWTTLFPTPRHPETNVGDVLIFPRQSSDGHPRYARINLVTGVQRVLVALTREPLPFWAMGILLNAPVDPGGLNQLATTLNNRLAASAARLLSRRFLVSPAAPASESV